MVIYEDKSTGRAHKIWDQWLVTEIAPLKIVTMLAKAFDSIMCPTYLPLSQFPSDEKFLIGGKSFNKSTRQI